MTGPLWALPLALLLVYLPRAWVARGQARAPGGYDNHDPRGQQATLDGVARRAHAAHLNGFESFAPFAAAVLTAHVTRANGPAAAALAALYLAARTLYVAFYLADRATLRSLAWGVGLAAVLGLFGAALLR